MSQSNIVDVFKASFPAPTAIVEEMAKEFSPQLLSKGEEWLRPGQYCQHIGFLNRGLIRAAVETKTGLHTRWAFLPGQFFTSIQSFTTNSPSRESLIAIEDCEIFVLGRDRWQALYEKHEMLRRFWTASLETLTACFEDRVHTLLMDDGKARYQHMLDHYPEFVLQVPQKYVAEMLGIAPRHLSRIRKELAEK